MSGIQEQIERVVAEIESEANRDDLTRGNRRIAILREQLARQIAHRDAIAGELAARAAAAAHTDALLDEVLPRPIEDTDIDLLPKIADASYDDHATLIAGVEDARTEADHARAVRRYQDGRR